MCTAGCVIIFIRPRRIDVVPPPRLIVLCPVCVLRTLPGCVNSKWHAIKLEFSRSPGAVRLSCQGRTLLTINPLLSPLNHHPTRPSLASFSEKNVPESNFELAYTSLGGTFHFPSSSKMNVKTRRSPRLRRRNFIFTVTVDSSLLVYQSCINLFIAVHHENLNRMFG